MKLRLLFIYEKNVDEDTPVSIVNSKREFDEFVYRRICLKNYDHYKLWCDIHSQQIDSYDSIVSYVLTVRKDDLKLYFARKLYFKKFAVSSIFRMFNKCLPVGGSYETPFEQEYMNQLIEETFKNVTESKTDNSKI